ncbi:tRNA 2-thiouridine synthesizing protein D [Colwellia chukchiensis]|uniref:tRNA 2-thiouridine synthesizing protein D n=1 Tax=Colwellia chukchiensis TaxID=641665 RepID=A0A1H7MM01_9GAMM|nr:sulfurtransferase complex subunit TusD [Colwellia chukchiensis]SEL12109.1 tRNA 2-thiouridine synthesizing protein D [Colwellia chukchiensis]
MHNTLALVVTTPPNSNLTTTAINLIKSALASGVEVIGVFFYQDGVLNAAKHLSIPSDEYQSLAHWQQLNHDHHIPLHLCITAAEKRGLSDEHGEHAQSTIAQSFTVSGLGELVELTSKAQRVVQL